MRTQYKAGPYQPWEAGPSAPLSGLLSEPLSVRVSLSVGVSAVCQSVCYQWGYPLSGCLCLWGCLLSVGVSTVYQSVSVCQGVSVGVSSVCQGVSVSQGVHCLSGCPLCIRVSAVCWGVSVRVSSICRVLSPIRRGPPLQRLMHCWPLSHPRGLSAAQTINP